MLNEAFVIFPSSFAAFITHAFEVPISKFEPSFCKWGSIGNSWITARKSDASPKGTAKANVVSCEIGDRGFQVVGSDSTELLAGMCIVPAAGAIRGKVLDKESGNTKVMRVVCCAFC